MLNATSAAVMCMPSLKLTSRGRGIQFAAKPGCFPNRKDQNAHGGAHSILTLQAPVAQTSSQLYQNLNPIILLMSAAQRRSLTYMNDGASGMPPSQSTLGSPTCLLYTSP